MTSLTETMKAAAVTTVVEIGAHLNFVSGASGIGALESFASFVLVSVRDSLARTPLCISIQVGDHHDGTRMLKK